MTVHRNGACWIKQAAEETGISAHRLRVWEARYGWPNPVHHANGYRRYPDWLIAEIKRVKRMMDLSGKPIGEVLALTRKPR